MLVHKWLSPVFFPQSSIIWPPMERVCVKKMTCTLLRLICILVFGKLFHLVGAGLWTTFSLWSVLYSRENDDHFVLDHSNHSMFSHASECKHEYMPCMQILESYRTRTSGAASVVNGEVACWDASWLVRWIQRSRHSNTP